MDAITIYDIDDSAKFEFDQCQVRNSDNGGWEA